MPKRLVESQALATTTGKSGRLQVQLISPGWGSSGYYSPKVLENAAQARVFAAGTHMYLDHPSESERHDRPERSVRDLAAVLAEDAKVGDGGALVAEVQAFGPHKDLLTDEKFAEAIGVSIVAYADTTIGEAEGRKGTIITELTEGVSTDFVTRAGRGGKVLAVLESARRGVREATANDTREALSSALRAAYGAEETWVWVRDFDDDASLVWFTVEDADSMTTYQQGYTLDDAGTATLADGDPTEVRARTEYVPVTTDATEASRKPPVTPAGSTTHTHNSEEEHMGTTQIEEGRLAQLEADAGRVPTLEAERDQANDRATQAEAAAQAAANREAAAGIIAEAGHPFNKMERAGLMATLPVTESGALDAEAFTATVTEAAAEAARSAGAGSVRGFGATNDGERDYAAEADKATASAFGRTVKEA